MKRKVIKQLSKKVIRHNCRRWCYRILTIPFKPFKHFCNQACLLSLEALYVTLLHLFIFLETHVAKSVFVFNYLINLWTWIIRTTFLYIYFHLFWIKGFLIHILHSFKKFNANNTIQINFRQARICPIMIKNIIK